MILYTHLNHRTALTLLHLKRLYLFRTHFIVAMVQVVKDRTHAYVFSDTNTSVTGTQNEGIMYGQDYAIK